MQCDCKCVDLDKASGYFGGLWRIRVFHTDHNVTFVTKMVLVHNACCVHFNKYKLSNFFFFFMPFHTLHVWKRKIHTYTKHYKMSLPCCSHSVIYCQGETWACFDEHKKGILVNWEPAGSTAVGVTIWVGTDDKYTQSSRPTTLSFTVFDFYVIQSCA